jgi:hypothetical protein
MRIVSGSTTESIYFVAFSTADHTTRVTGHTTAGFTAHFSIANSTGSTHAVAFTQINSTQCPGLYSLTIADSTITTLPAGVDSRELAIVIAGSMDTVTRTVELYRRSVTTGATLVLNSSGEPTNVMAALSTISGMATSILDDTGTSGVVLVNDAITAGKIAANAITSSEIADGAITAAKFAAGAIDATAIADGAIDAATFAAGAIDATAIANGAIDAATFAAGAIDAAAIATGAIDSDALAASAVDEIWDEAVEGARTARQLMRLYAAALGGKASGLETTTAVYRDTNDTMPVITATVDADGNRTAVTLDLDDTP